jgi:hypothetical protein
MKWIPTLCLLFGPWAHAAGTSTTLTTYTSEQNYESAAYSFRTLSHDKSVTGGKYELLFQVGNVLDSQLNAGDLGAIVDLGTMACADIKNYYEQSGAYPGKDHTGYPWKEDRKENPMLWLEFSEAWDKLAMARDGHVPAVAGHCYIEHQTSYDGVTIALFHVQSLKTGVSVTIDEIEVFQVALFTKK